MNILNQMKSEAIGKVINQLEYATHNLKLIRSKVEAGEELTPLEQTFLEGYLS